MHHKFNLARVQTHDLQIMDTTFHLTQILVLTTGLLGTLKNSEETLACFKVAYIVLIKIFATVSRTLKERVKVSVN